MKVHDVVVGLVFVCFGIFVVAYSQTLSPPRHLTYGPGFFPSLIGGGLILVGAGIAAQGLRTLRLQPLAVSPDWLGSPLMAVRFWVLPVGVVFYLFAVEALGFLLTVFLMLTAILKANGVSTRGSVVVGFAVAAVVNIVFASLLHVPLAWGLLEPVSGWFLW